MLYPLWETESPVRRNSGRQGKTISRADSVQRRESRHTASRIIHREKFYVRAEESAPGIYAQVHTLQTAWTLALRRLPTGFHQPVRPPHAGQNSNTYGLSTISVDSLWIALCMPLFWSSISLHPVGAQNLGEIFCRLSRSYFWF